MNLVASIVFGLFCGVLLLIGGAIASILCRRSRLGAVALVAAGAGGVLAPLAFAIYFAWGFCAQYDGAPRLLFLAAIMIPPAVFLPTLRKPHKA